MREIVVALSTVPMDFEVRQLARTLVEQQLAACVTIFPAVQSVYTWQGAIEESQEVQIAIKTTRDRVAALWTALKAAHPYDVPEFLVLSVVDGNPEYLAWVEKSVPRA